MISLTNTRKGKKCAFYLRTNQVHQTRDHSNHSIDSQKEYLSDWASREGMEVVGVYSDVGKSGYSISGRDEFRRMLNDVISHKIDIDYVMVSELSRFGRNTKDVSDALSIIQQHGVNLLYPCDDTGTGCFDSLCGSLNWDWATFAKKVR